MTYTIAQARNLLAELILDPGKDRQDNDDLDDFLRGALFACLKEYTSEGGMLFAKLADVTTDASGEYDMSSDRPLVIHAVSVHDVEGGTFSQLESCQPHLVSRLYTEVENLRLHYTPYPDTTWDADGRAFVSGVDVDTPHEHSDYAFEKWVVYFAALEALAPVDRDVRWIQGQRDRYMRSCIRHLDVMESFAMEAQSYLDQRARMWSYRPDLRQLFLVNKGGYYR